VQSNFPAENTQNQVKSLLDTLFCLLITEALRNCAQKLDASDIEDRERLGYNYQNLMLFGEVKMPFLFKSFGDNREYTAWG